MPKSRKILFSIPIFRPDLFSCFFLIYFILREDITLQRSRQMGMRDGSMSRQLAGPGYSIQTFIIP